MFNSLIEKMMTDYYKTCLVVPYADKEQIFDIFAKIYGLDKATADELKRICNSPELESFNTEKDVNLYYRTCEVLKINRCSNPIDLLSRQLIAVKSDAIRQLTQHKLINKKGETLTQMWRTLWQAAENGVVDAMRIGGLLLQNNIISYNNGNGAEWLDKAASWLDYTALLYCYQMHMESCSKLKLDYLSMIKYACDYYGYSYPKCVVQNMSRVENLRNGFLLTFALKNGKVNLGQIDPIIHGIIYSFALSDSDKDKLIMRNEYSTADLSLLPLNIKHDIVGPSLLLKACDRFRSDEMEHIANMYLQKGLRTVAIKSSDADMLDKIEQIAVAAHGAVADEHAEVINVSALHAEDFVKNCNNVFIRSCVDNVANAVILRLDGSISDDVLQAVNEFLTDRQCYQLSRPSVVMDLSDVFVYCLADANNAERLSGLSFVNVLPMTKQEKIEFIRQSAAAACACNTNAWAGELTDQTIDMLCGYSLKTVDKALRELFNYADDALSSSEKLKDVLEKYDKKPVNNYGFGGYKQ